MKTHYSTGAGAGIGIAPPGFIDIYAVANKMGVSKSTAWAIVKKRSDFPNKYKFGWRTSRWREEEVDAWIAEQIRLAEVI